MIVARNIIQVQIPLPFALDVATVLPGHGSVFTDLRGRLHEIRVHHDMRLGEIAKAAAGGATAYEVTPRLFPLADLSAHQVQFAMGETLAHLEHLLVQGRLERVEGAQIIYRMVE
jgi:glyoxylase-like metal-dependent hydrolase (beta-lactamase superfamily II)